MISGSPSEMSDALDRSYAEPQRATEQPGHCGFVSPRDLSKIIGQHARDMHRLAAGAILDLMPARRAVGDDDGVSRALCAPPASSDSSPMARDTSMVSA